MLNIIELCLQIEAFLKNYPNIFLFDVNLQIIELTGFEKSFISSRKSRVSVLLKLKEMSKERPFYITDSSEIVLCNI